MCAHVLVMCPACAFGVSGVCAARPIYAYVRSCAGACARPVRGVLVVGRKACSLYAYVRACAGLCGACAGLVRGVSAACTLLPRFFGLCSSEAQPSPGQARPAKASSGEARVSTVHQPAVVRFSPVRAQEQPRQSQTRLVQSSPVQSSPVQSSPVQSSPGQARPGYAATATGGHESR